MLSVYRLDQSEQWDSVVRSFGKYDVYWLSGYVKAFEIHGDGEPLLFYYEDGSTRGINVVMKRDIASDPKFDGKLERGKYFDFATPYGYGGWIIEGDDSSRLFEEYSKWVRKNGIISEFVRFHPMVHNHTACEDFYEVIPLGEVVHMDLSDPEGIWSNRFRYADELRRMGASFTVDGKIAVISGVERLQAAPVMSTDLRAGAAMVIAGLCAQGTTEVSGVEYIDRGYEDFVGKLSRLGADVKRIQIPDPVSELAAIG